MRDQGIGSWAARRARMSPDQIAIIDEGQEWTYRQLHERTTRFANGLTGLGVGRGDRVAYLGPNHLTFVETLFGATRLGAIFIPLNSRLTPTELAYILEDSGTSVLVYAPSHAEHVSALRSLVNVPHLVDFNRYAELVASSPATPVDEPIDRDEVAMILYTSGTTGHPKGAALSHANIHWNSFNVLIDVDLSGDEVTLVSAPMFHVAALNQTVLPTLLKGGTVVLMPSFDPEATLKHIELHRVTYFLGVPAMFQAIANTPGWANADLSSVRTLICGGSPVPPHMIAIYQERGLTFLQGYGLTETSPSGLVLRARDSRVKAGSAGTPCFLTDVRIVDVSGEEVAPGEPGEVLLHGSNVMKGYWNKPDATAAVLSPDGWLRTGDVAVSDEDGFIYIRDRIKDVIISGGENIYPAEVEDVLLRHPAVAECAIIGVPDEKWGEVGLAVVLLRDGATAEPAELLGFLDGKLARYKIPKSVRFTDTFPRTGSGKVQKAKLRAALNG